MRTTWRRLPASAASATATGGSGTLAPLFVALDGMRGAGPSGLDGLADPLIVSDLRGWTTVRDLAGGPAFGHLASAAHRHWPSAPPTELALAWKDYSYWAMLPTVVSWAVSRRVPLLGPRDVLARFPPGPAPVRIGFRHARVAVLPDDVLAVLGTPAVIVLDSEPTMLAVLRDRMLAQQLRPLAERIRRERRVGRRTLLGTLAAGVAHILVRAADLLPTPPARQAGVLLEALGLAQLVELSGEPPVVRRRTCCLAYRGPRGYACAGCCLPAAVARSPGPS